MSPTTLFLGKLLGLYLVAISLALLADRRRALAVIDDMSRSGPWMLFSGMTATAIGLALVLRGRDAAAGALPVALDVAGAMALLKGLSLLLIPPERIAAGYRLVGFARMFSLWMGVVLALGFAMAALAFAG